MTSFKLAAGGMLAAAAIALPLVQHQSLNQLREENRSLREQLAHSSQFAREDSLPPKADIAGTRPQVLSEQQHSELLRLRGEVSRLRAENKEIEVLRQENRRRAESGAASETRGANAGWVSHTNALYVRTFKVDTQVWLSQLTPYATTESTTSTNNAEFQKALLQYLKDNSIIFETPSTAFLDQRTGTLLVRGSMENLEKVEKLALDLGAFAQTQ